MKIAITGARGTVGQEVVKLCLSQNHTVIQINRTPEDPPSTHPSSESRVADIASDYTSTLSALRGAEALIHLAAIPNPVNTPDHLVHANNVTSAFNGFHAACTLGITRICYASSVNALGLAYANQPLTHFQYFPIDESHPQNPTDSYALAKSEAEMQAHAFVNWFPGTKIACLRIHEVAPRAEVAKEHAEDFEGKGVKQLWGWVSPAATARACLAAVENVEKFEGAEVFNVHARSTAQETASRELAGRWFPGVEIRVQEEVEKERGNWGFWDCGKAERVLGWRHEEDE